MVTYGVSDEGLKCQHSSHMCLYPQSWRGRSKQVRSRDSGATEPLSAVHDNVGPCKGTSVHPLCVRKRERLKWRASELNCSPLSLVFSH